MRQSKIDHFIKRTTEFINEWRDLDKECLDLWIYWAVIEYGYIYFQSICMDLLALTKMNMTKELKFRRINELFRKATQRLIEPR